MGDIFVDGYFTNFSLRELVRTPSRIHLETPATLSEMLSKLRKLLVEPMCTTHEWALTFTCPILTPYSPLSSLMNNELCRLLSSTRLKVLKKLKKITNHLAPKRVFRHHTQNIIILGPIIDLSSSVSEFHL